METDLDNSENEQDLFDLDTTLLDFSSKEFKATWTTRHAVEGVQIFGGIGSGKTSGSGRMIAQKFLKNNFGGLVLTAKAEEKDLWIDYMQAASRSMDDLIIVEPNGDHSFDFLAYEATNSKHGVSITDNILQVLKTVIRSGEERQGGKSDDRFWESALDMLIFNSIDLCQLAFGSVSVEQLYNIIMTAPKKEDAKLEGKLPPANSLLSAYGKVRDKIKIKSDEIKSSLTIQQKQQLTPDLFDEMLAAQVPEYKLLMEVDQFFFETYKNLGEKTRSIIEFIFIGFLFRLRREPVRSLFCSNKITFTPEDSLEGKIILINLPVKQYHKVGRDCQIMFKYIWQRAMEKRDVKTNGRPVFLWADEAQNFLHEYDAEYQATARSSRIATVYLTQNLPNYHANMGGDKSAYLVKSFLGTLATKIFHANADIETNIYASDLIGEMYTESIQTSKTISKEISTSESTSLVLEKVVRPENLASLMTGGPANGFIVEAYIHRQGSPFPGGNSFRKIKFNQHS